tara:strand:- start:25057 stop:25422 length:366 start_codon:yes stop_codon:yes gene_type:complete
MEAPIVKATQVKQLREETGMGMITCKKLLERFGGDVEFAKSYAKYVSHAVYIKGNREERDMLCAIKEVGRKPYFDSNEDNCLLTEDQKEVDDILIVLLALNQEDKNFSTKFKEQLNQILND